MKKRIIVALFVLFMFVSSGSVNAKDYTATKTGSIVLQNASIPYKYKATYHSTGNTKWSSSWSVISVPAKLKSATVKQTKFTVRTNNEMVTEGTFTALDLNYVSSTGRKGYTCTYSSGSVKIK